jgi:hypothetical protein
VIQPPIMAPARRMASERASTLMNLCGSAIPEKSTWRPIAIRITASLSTCVRRALNGVEGKADVMGLDAPEAEKWSEDQFCGVTHPVTCCVRVKTRPNVRRGHSHEDR